MHMLSSTPLLVWLLVGMLAGIIAYVIAVGCSASGLLTNLVVGIVGALLAGWFFPQLHMSLGSDEWVNMIVPAAAGAIILLVVLRLVKRAV